MRRRSKRTSTINFENPESNDQDVIEDRQPSDIKKQKTVSKDKDVEFQNVWISKSREDKLTTQLRKIYKFVYTIAGNIYEGDVTLLWRGFKIDDIPTIPEGKENLKSRLRSPLQLLASILLRGVLTDEDREAWKILFGDIPIPAKEDKKWLEDIENITYLFF